MARGVVVVALTMFVAYLLAASAAAHAMSARVVEFKPLIDWNGTVVVAVPESLLQSFADLYVSNTSNCSVVLPTDWVKLGGMVYVVFNTTEELKNGTLYRFYLCYGDVVAPHPRLYCSLPGNCSTTVDGGRLVDGRSLVIDVDSNPLRIASASDSVDDTSDNITIDMPDTLTYRASTTIDINTTTRQAYSVLLDGRSVTLNGPYLVENKMWDKSYDTGYWLADTGVYPVYDFGREVLVTSGYITATVYDSRGTRDDYYLIIYIDGQPVATYYQPSTVNFTFSNIYMRNISIEVVDTTTWLVYVRAYGSFHAEHKIWRYNATVAVSRFGTGDVAVNITAANRFIANITATVNYYDALHKCAAMYIGNDTTEYFFYVKGLLPEPVFSDYAEAEPNNTTDSVLKLVDNSRYLLQVPGKAASEPYDSNAVAAGYPGFMSINTSYGSTTVSNRSVTGGRGPAKLEYCIYAGPPGSYWLNWSQVRAYPALFSYTDLYIGPEYTVSAGPASNGASNGGGAVTVVVKQENPYSEKMFKLVLAIVETFCAAGALWFSASAILRSSMLVALPGFLLALVGAVTAGALGYYTVAKAMVVLAVAALLAGAANDLLRVLEWAVRRATGT